MKEQFPPQDVHKWEEIKVRPEEIQNFEEPELQEDEKQIKNWKLQKPDQIIIEFSKEILEMMNWINELGKGEFPEIWKSAYLRLLQKSNGQNTWETNNAKIDNWP